MTPTADVAVAGRTGPLCEASSDRSSTIASQAIVARCCSRTSDYTIVQRYTRERISYWLCGARRPRIAAIAGWAKCSMFATRRWVRPGSVSMRRVAEGQHHFDEEQTTGRVHCLADIA